MFTPWLKNQFVIFLVVINSEEFSNVDTAKYKPGFEFLSLTVYVNHFLFTETVKTEGGLKQSLSSVVVM
jgi:hypothetical protein